MNGPRKRIVASVLVTTLLVALVFMVVRTQGTAAKQAQPADEVVAAQAPAAPPQSATAAIPDGATVTMKIHGSWTIVVVDPDGTVVERRDFENAFVGSNVMTGFLTRSTYVGFWQVRLGPLLCQFGTTQKVSHDCWIEEPGLGPNPTEFVFLNLQVTSSAGTVRLAGSATMAYTASVTEVQTWVSACPTATLTQLCPPSPFTSKLLATPIAVQAGQQVQVTVVFSFS